MMTAPKLNNDGTWTIQVMVNGKLTEQRVNLEWIADHLEDWIDAAVDEDHESQHTSSIANEEQL